MASLIVFQRLVIPWFGAAIKRAGAQTYLGMPNGSQREVCRPNNEGGCEHLHLET